MIGMRAVLTVSHWIVRITGVLQLLSGLLLWVGDVPPSVVPWHTLDGVILVIALLVLSAVSTRLGAPTGMAIGAAVVALVVLVLGLIQTTLIPGGTHWIIQVVHALIGVAAVGLGEGLGGRVRRARLAMA